MGTRKGSSSSSDRAKWGKVFDGLVKLIKNQQEQLETILSERKLLEDRIKMQHERWVSDIRHYESQITQMSNDLTEKEMTCLVLAAKSELLTGLKQREASFNKLKLEKVEDELADFRGWFDYLSDKLSKSSKENELQEERNNTLNSAGSKTLKDEVRRLQLQYEKLSSDKSNEISALLSEKQFVWNQYNILESNLSNKLEGKQAEVEQANEKIAKLLATLESLQSSISEKDETIGRLTAKVSEMETDGIRWKQEISKLSQELELLRKSTCSQTPVLKACKGRAKTSRLQGASSGQENIVVKKELVSNRLATFPVKKTAKDSKSLKRGEVEIIDIQDTPKLFTSSFKIPKLKIVSTVR
ncbi:hypothetical protein Tsubulata_010169 [Turnera subulata]|uniref:Uncharacterized protein n=1 Tax=Turnera subulata TaxID=218843 RepID=A0A9Q0G759_9ROSI|nr:hypothetical protein Tsubulata_010169 [Turnera subulata]